MPLHLRSSSVGQKFSPRLLKACLTSLHKRLMKTKNTRECAFFAVDGSDFLLAANPDDPDFFFPGTDEQKSYNLLHLNALYDLVQHIYVDAILQKRRKADECGALVSMVLTKHISPIRPGRSRPRKPKPKQALSFLYRVA